MNVDRVYVAASKNDERFTRTCVASIRTYHPDVPIHLLCGGRVSRKLRVELRHAWGVDECLSIERGEYGWGFVKLEPLFAPANETFLVLDSDTVMTGPVLHLAKGSTAAFIVDREQQGPEDAKRLYYDWERLKAIAPSTVAPRFLFNSGQWFGTSGVLSREDFSQWVQWTMPRRLSYPDYFMGGEQGVLNYVLNQKAAQGDFKVDAIKLMHWPGHGMRDLTRHDIERSATAPIIIHWAGVKRLTHASMPGADILRYFEELYYRRIHHGSLYRRLRKAIHIWRGVLRLLRSRIALM